MTRPDSSLTVIQQRRLAERAFRWVQTVRRLNRSAEAGDSAEAIDSVHMLAVALRHLDRCVLLLQRAVPVEGGRTFRRSWRSVSELRDVLEHEEEYVAGAAKIGRRAWVRIGWTGKCSRVTSSFGTNTASSG